MHAPPCTENLDLNFPYHTWPLVSWPVLSSMFWPIKKIPHSTLLYTCTVYFTIGWVIFWDSSFSQVGNCQWGSYNQKVVLAKWELCFARVGNSLFCFLCELFVFWEWKSKSEIHSFQSANHSGCSLLMSDGSECHLLQRARRTMMSDLLFCFGHKRGKVWWKVQI